MTLKEFLVDAKKAVAALGTVEAAAVALGVLDNATAGYVTAGLGAVTAVIVWVTENVPAAKK